MYVVNEIIVKVQIHVDNYDRRCANRYYIENGTIFIW